MTLYGPHIYPAHAQKKLVIKGVTGFKCVGAPTATGEECALLSMLLSESIISAYQCIAPGSDSGRFKKVARIGTKRKRYLRAFQRYVYQWGLLVINRKYNRSELCSCVTNFKATPSQSLVQVLVTRPHGILKSQFMVTIMIFIEIMT